MSGNAKLIGPGKWANFQGKVSQNLWPALKPSVERGEFDLGQYDSAPVIIKALRSGFLSQASDSLPDLGLNTGKVSKEELAKLSVWELKHLQEFFYQQIFGLYVRFPDELMPEAPDELSWPICMLGNLTSEDTFRGGKLDPLRWKWTNNPLDAELNLSRGRDAWKHSYIVRVRSNWEADEDMKNISGDDADAKNLNVLMLRERLYLGAFLFWLTGDHLDRKTVTLTGSRYSDGGVASVSFYPSNSKIRANRWNLSNAYDNLRFRQAVSQ